MDTYAEGYGNTSRDNLFTDFDCSEVTADDVGLNDVHSQPSRRRTAGVTRPSTRLTERMLREINRSILVFKPSKSLHLLTTSANNRLPTRDQDGSVAPAAEIDVVISGGALKGYFMCGCTEVLLPELKKQNIAIRRAAGASAGAWASFFLLNDVPCDAWIETYHLCQANASKTIHEVYEEIAPWILSLLEPDAYIKSCGRLFISITVMTYTGPKNMLISEFTSNEDMLLCCMASSTIPFVTERKGFRRYR